MEADYAILATTKPDIMYWRATEKACELRKMVRCNTMFFDLYAV